MPCASAWKRKLHAFWLRSNYWNPPKPEGANRLKPLAIILFFACAIAANADTIRGAVQNGTTNRPSAEDEVLLKKIGQTMEDVGKTRTSGKGEFSFTVPAIQTPYLIWVKHQDVTYTAVVRPGTSGTVAVRVFDATPS